MRPGSTRAPTWAALPQELVQQAARLLGDDDRLVMLRVCPAWQAVVLASPELMPAPAVLSAPPLEVAAIDRDIRYWRFAMSQARDTANAKLLLDKVAAVNPLAWHVRLQVVDDQPLLVLGVLLALPRGVRILELDAPCAGPLLEALKRFSRLHELRIGGNGAGITWSCPGAAGLLSKLVQLRMDFRGKPIWKDEYVYPPKEDGIPTHTGGALAAATRLRSLALCVSWSDGVPALCSALPALEELSLDIYYCSTANVSAAVAMRRQLPRLQGIKLGVHAYVGTEERLDYPCFDNDEGWEEWVRPPALAGLAALTALHLDGHASLPPDWRQLSSLQRLRVVMDGEEDIGDDWGFEWGTATLTALTALTRLEGEGLMPGAAVVASAPNLAEVQALGSSEDWRAELAALRPDVKIL